MREKQLTIRHLALAAVLALPLPALGQTPAAPRPAQPARPPASAPQAAAPAAAAAPDLVTEANLSRDGLKAMFDAAKLPTAIEGGEKLTVKVGAVVVYVLPGKDRVRLLATYSFAARAAYQEKLDLANRINDGYIVIRAAIPADRPGEIAIDHYILLGTGVSRATVVAVTRRFADIVREAVDALDTDRLLK